MLRHSAETNELYQLTGLIFIYKGINREYISMLDFFQLASTRNEAW
jgi:hypothetical protein